MAIRTSGRRGPLPAGLAGLAVLLLCLGLGGCATGVARPAAPPGSSTAGADGRSATPALTTAERLDDLADQVTGGRDEADVPGLAGLSVDPSRGALELWWVGDLPESVRRLVAAPPRGLSVTVRPGTYDVAAMVAAARRLTHHYAVLHEAGPEGDGSGVEVETTAKGARTLPTPGRLGREVGMPVRVVLSEPPVAA